MHEIDEQKVRDRAFQLWDAAGQPEGREQEFWYAAEQELAEQGKADISQHNSEMDKPPLMPGRLG
ncbi:DUF2934 domain-containing protein [Devosia faecipullorum]|uniref:DUF2934 domain-containing protein n=1 Tax=Devosia faecipullorum TaxID=2755039 RepID=UPI00187B9215|nr:DUF2934 domain-containing protein [Devosia faecipullorum]MBE7733159.1 DUF2934 domain-containing protein [Devosia faecipullorum]